MASLDKTAVSNYPVSDMGKYIGKDQTLVQRRLKLVLTGQGGQTNTIPAAALGFSNVHKAEPLWDAINSKGYPAVVDPVNNIVILLDGSAAPAPVDVTTTAGYIVVTGTPAIAR